MCDERDWSSLPIELINLISKKLPKRSDFVKFRAVCKTWCSYTPLSDYPPQFPWLIEDKGDYNPLNKSLHGIRFYSPFSGKTGNLFRKQSCRGKSYKGIELSHGYLLLCDLSTKKLSYVLFNPLTNEEIRLPFLHFLGHPYLVWTGTNSIHNQDVIVVERNIETKKNSWAFYDRDNNDWIVSNEGPIYYSYCYCRGMLFSSKGGCSTHIFDISTKKKLYEIPPLKDELPPFLSPASFLVESAGEILRVSLKFEWKKFETTTTLSIHKLEFDGRNNPICWIKINNIGDHIIFLDSTNGFSISSKSFPEQRGNCIYFLFPHSMPYIYNIEDGKTTQLWCPFNHPSTWFIPDLG